MNAGMGDARARIQKREEVMNATALIAATKATSKAAASSQVVITNRYSSLSAYTSDKHTFREDAKGKTTDTSIYDADGANDADSQGVSAKTSLARTLTEEIERLKAENRRQDDTIRKLNTFLANLEQNLEFKKAECLHLTRQVEQREQAIIDSQTRFDNEQLRHQRAMVESDEKCKVDRVKLQGQMDSLKKQKEHLNKSLSEMTIEKVSAIDTYHAEQKKTEDLETALQQVDSERQSLQNIVTQMKEGKGKRETEINQYVRTAQSQIKSLEAEINRLTSQGNRLVAQNSRRRTHIPAEDESRVIDKFYALHDGVRCWSIDVIEAVQAERPGAELEFSKFPLGEHDARMKMSTDEIQLLIAYVWEWLMRSVFGSDQCRESLSDPLFDLWSEEEVAHHLSFLEHKVFALQKAGIAHEWRSFTVQCLAEKIDVKDSTRIKNAMDEVCSWLLPMSKFNDEETSEEAMESLLQAFQINILIPAIEFSKILRQQFTPILLRTPELLEDGVENWYKMVFDHTEERPELEIVIRPQLCKEEVDPASGERSKIETLVEAEKFKMVDLNDPVESSSSNQTEEEDEKMFDA